jgi:tetratricopeptide (TPR) repeat protein
MLCLDHHQPRPWFFIERLEMRLPDVAFPFDLGEGLARFRSKHCRLMRLEAGFDLKVLAERLSEADQFAGLSFRRVRLDEAQGFPLLVGNVHLTNRKAPFSVRLEPFVHETGLALRLSRLRVYSLLPIPTPLVGLALLAAAGAPRYGEQSFPAGAQLLGPVECAVDLVGWILWETLLVEGWRIPDYASVEARRWRFDAPIGKMIWGERREDNGACTETGSAVNRTDSGKDVDPKEGDTADAVDTQGELNEQGNPADATGNAEKEKKTAENQVQAVGRAWQSLGSHVDACPAYFRSERLLAQGRLAEAFEVLSESVAQNPDDHFVLERFLQMSACSADGADQAARLSRAALEKWPEWEPALLALAAVHQLQDEPMEAAARLSQLASVDKQKQNDTEALCASLACGRILYTVDPEQAMGWYSRVLLDDPENEEAIESLIALYEQKGRWRELVPLLRRRTAQGSREQRIAAHVALGRCYLSCLKDALRARAEFEKALRMDDAAVKAWQGLANAHLASEDPQRALSALQRLKRVFEEATDPSVEAILDCELKSAQALEALGEWSGALERLQRAHMLAPQNTEIDLRLAELGRRVEDWALVADVLLRLAERPALGNGRRVEAYVELAQIEAIHNEDDGAAQAALDRALEVDPRAPAALEMAAEWAEKQGRLEELVEVLQQMIAVERDAERRAGLLVRRARALVELPGRMEEAAEGLSSVAAARGPHALGALEVLATLQRRKQQTQELIATLQEWIDLAAGDPGKALEKAAALMELAALKGSVEGQQSETVRRLLVRAVQLTPKDTKPLFQLAAVLEKQQDSRELESVLRRLANLLRSQQRWQELAQVLEKLGRVLLALKRPEQAAEPLREACRLEPDNLGLMLTLADAEFRQGHHKPARSAYEKIWQSGSGDAHIRALVATRLAELLWQEGSQSQAVEFCRAALDLGIQGDLRHRCWKKICDWNVDRKQWSDAAQSYAAMVADEDLELNSGEAAELLFTAAELHHQHSADHASAIKLCWRVLELRPHHRGALNALESLLLAAEQFEEVVGVLERKIAAAQGHRAEKVALLGRKAQVEAERLGRVQAARRTYRQALEIDPEYLPGLLFLAQDDYRLQNWQDCVEIYEKVLSLPDDPRWEALRDQHNVTFVAHKTIARVAEKAGWANKLETHATWVLDREPGDKEVLAIWQHHLEETQRWHELAPLLRRSAELGNQQQAVEMKLKLAAVLFERLDEPQEAAEVYREILRAEPDHPRALVCLAEVLERENRPAEHLKVIEKLVAVTQQTSDRDSTLPSAEKTLYTAARLAAELHEYDKAEQFLQARLKHGQPDEKSARLNLVLAEQRGEPHAVDEALDVLAAVLKDEEQIRVVRLKQARWKLEGQNDPSGTLAVLEAFFGDPSTTDETQQIVLRAEAHQALEQWEEAYRSFELLAERAQQKRDENAEMEWRERLFDLAEIALSEDEAAEQHGLRLLELDEGRAAVAARLADLYRRQGDTLMMRRMLERQLHALEQTAPQAEQRVALMLELASLWRQEPEKGLERAEQLCRKALELAPTAAPVIGQLTEVLMAQERYDQAVEVLEHLVAAAADRSDQKISAAEAGRYHLELASIYDTAFDDGERCRHHGRLAARALSGDARSDALEIWMRRALADAHWEEAAEAGETLRDLRGSKEDLDGLAVAYENLGRLDEAVRMVSLLQQDAPADPALKRRLRRLYERAGRHEELAEALLTEADQTVDPDRVVELLYSAADHFSARREGREKAEQCLLRTLEIRPTAQETFARLFRLSKEREQRARFFDLVRDVALGEQGEASDKAELLVWAAGLRIEAPDEEARGETMALLHRALEIAPDHLSAWQALARLHDGRADEVEALARCLEKITDLSPAGKSTKARIRLVHLYLDTLNTPERAAALLDRVGEEMDDVEQLELYAHALIGAGRLQEAEQVLGRVAAVAATPHEACIRAADLAAERKDVVAERGWLHEAMTLGGEMLPLAQRLVDLERKIGEPKYWAQALELVIAHESAPKAKAEAMAELARVLLSESPHKSLELLKQGARLVPENMQIRHQLAEVALQSGELEIAVEALAEIHQKQVGEGQDSGGDISMEMARIMAEQGDDLDAARDLYRRAADEYRDAQKQMEALRFTAEMAARTGASGMEEEALRALEEAFSQDAAQSANARLARARRLVDLCHERGAWGEVIARAEALQERGVADRKLYHQQAVALEALGHWEKAADCWIRAAEPQKADETIDLERLLRAAALKRDRMQDIEGALELFRRALQLNPIDADVMSQIESLCRKNERWEDLLTLKELSLQGRDEADRARVLHAMAVIRERKLNDLDGSASLLARAHALDPTLGPVLRPLGEYHFRNREWEPARYYFERALEVQELDASAEVDVLDRLARIARAEDDAEQELAHLTAAVRLESGREELWNRAEEVLRRKGDLQGLVELLKKRSELSTGSQRNRRLLEAARLVDQELGKPPEAIALYHRVVELNPEDVQTRKRLLALLRETGRWKELVSRLEAELLLCEGAAKAQVAEEMASLLESKTQDEVAAERYYRLAYREDAGNPKRIRALADHLARRHKWEDLTDFLEMALDTVALPDRALAGFMALLGRTYLEKLDREDKALEVFERARARKTLTGRSVELLSQIYWDRKQYAELASLLRHELGFIDESVRRQRLLAKLADLLEGPVAEKSEAAALRAELFEADPQRHKDQAVRACELYLNDSRYEEAENLARRLAEMAEGEEKPQAELRWGLILLDFLGREEQAFAVLNRVVAARPDLAHAHLALGRILFTRGELGQALFHLEIVAAGEVQDPELSAEAHQLAGAAAEELQRPEDARLHLEAAFEQDPTNDGVLRALDRLYTSTGGWEKLARVLAREIDLEADPEVRAKLWYRRALLNRDILDDMPEALRCLKEAVAVAPHFVEAVSALRQSCGETGDWALAVQLVEREIAVETDAVRLAELELKRGQLLENKLHQPKQALESYRKAAQLDPKDPRAAEELARLLAHTGDWAAAAQATEELLKRRAGVEKGALLLRAAQLYQRAQQPAQAWRCWVTVLEEDTQQHWQDACGAMMAAAADRIQYEQMKTLLQDCLTRATQESEKIHLLRYLVRVMVELNETAAAEPYVSELLKRAPDDRTAFLHRRKALEHRGDWKSLETLLTQRLEVAQPEEQTELLLALGNLRYKETKDLKGAAEAFDSLLALEKDNTAALDARADIAYALGDYPLANELYIRLGDGPSVLARDERWYRRGEICEALGMEQDAVRQYEKAVDYNPAHRPAWEALCRMYLFAEKREAVVEPLEKLAELIPVGEVQTVLDVRIQLVATLLELDRVGEADDHLETLRRLVAQDNHDLLQLSLEVHRKLGQWKKATQDLEGLSQIVEDPKLKAQALFRQGEIHLVQLDDAEKATDCYLKAVDLDPCHIPTNRRLVEHYARRGAWSDMAEVSDILVDGEVQPIPRQTAQVQLAVALLLDGGSRAIEAPELLSTVNPDELQVEAIARILGNVSLGLRYSGHTMAPMSRVLDTLSSALGQQTLQSWLWAADRALQENPMDMGLRRLMPRLGSRVAQRWYGSQHARILKFLDSTDSEGSEARTPKSGQKVVNNALDPDGPALPPALRVPLRTALTALAPKLWGFGRAPYQAAGKQVDLKEVLSTEQVDRVRVLTRRMGTKDVVMQVTQSREVTVVAVDAAPPRILISQGAGQRPINELLFLVARELEWIRSGSLFLKDRVAEMKGVLPLALATALGIPTEDQNPRVEALADEMRAAGLNIDDLTMERQNRLLAALAQHAQDPIDAESYLREAQRMAYRIGLLACGDLLVALRATAAQIQGVDILDDVHDSERRALVLEHAGLLELIRFGTSRKIGNLVRRSTMSGY